MSIQKLWASFYHVKSIKKYLHYNDKIGLNYTIIKDIISTKYKIIYISDKLYHKMALNSLFMVQFWTAEIIELREKLQESYERVKIRIT